MTYEFDDINEKLRNVPDRTLVYYRRIYNHAAEIDDVIVNWGGYIGHDRIMARSDNRDVVRLSFKRVLGVEVPHFDTYYVPVIERGYHQLLELAIGKEEIKEALQRQGLETFCDFVDNIPETYAMENLPEQT